MNKTDLIAALTQSTNLTKTDAGHCLDSFLDIIQSALAAGESVTLPGFGAFSVKERAARNGRNPQTGEDIAIPASRVPVFKASKTLKNTVNE
jgi:DNA-binding protein HU-beta